MGLLGISLLVASVVYIAIRPPGWLAQRLFQWRGTLGGAITDVSQQDKIRHDDDTTPRIQESGHLERSADTSSIEEPSKLSTSSAAAVSPPPLPPTVQEPDSPTTPKASSATTWPQTAPGFASSDGSPTTSTPPVPSSSMLPPPIPAGRLPSAGRLPTLPQFPAPNSAQRARGPVPDRAPPGLSVGGLAPPPTHSSRPQKPGRKVVLDPGHSPLDWARISGPNADLRGVDPSTPYLRVTPSMLKKQTGRKGKDAWMALNGKVYNITPYAEFHPGGIPELMRGAARDGTKLFGEIHPWVNYETMLSACLVGLLVEEPSEASQESEMDQMD
ncbi:hypothetical protein C2857_007547 [Epichloe festucae Fl1]|uniref:Cytochrome b5 heme-binding domain-containing protein n=1 Tax=Epichloe festucae (strain Fl1) TaxID=877507 RepID=A0A7S9KMJ5_EPIFF|nr:hypothetical protein C2857_007547 [Epichloe festucae Fl1]